MAKRLRGRYGYPEANPFAVTLHPDRLDDPLHWRKPRRIFVCSMGDLFHEDVPNEFIAEVFDRMACATLSCSSTHQHEDECWAGEPHTFILLTKRPERALNFFTRGLDEATKYWPGNSPLCTAREVGAWPLHNVWLGVTAENQATADERIPILFQVSAAVHFVSAEPMLGPVDLSRFLRECPLDWVVAGGETGPGARPMHPDWARKVRDNCATVGAPFFFKSWGCWLPDTEPIPVESFEESPTHDWQDGRVSYLVGRKAAGRLLDGREYDELPEGTRATKASSRHPARRMPQEC